MQELQHKDKVRYIMTSYSYKHQLYMHASECEPSHLRTLACRCHRFAVDVGWCYAVMLLRHTNPTLGIWHATCKSSTARSGLFQQQQIRTSLGVAIIAITIMTKLRRKHDEEAKTSFRLIEAVNAPSVSCAKHWARCCRHVVGRVH